MSEVKWSARAWALRVDGLYFRIVHGEHRTKVAGEIISETNARLIAAAPDLLEALQAVETARYTDAEQDWLHATRLTDAALSRVYSGETHL